MCLAQRAGMQECLEPEWSAHSCWRRPKEKAGGWLTALPGERGLRGERRPRGAWDEGRPRVRRLTWKGRWGAVPITERGAVK